MGKRVLVVGTGTEIGKTHISCVLLNAMRRRKASWHGIKPIESGVGPGKLAQSDAARLAAAAGHPLHRPRYLFVEPISPHLAARRSDIEIDLEEVARWVGAFGEQDLVIETAGGLMSPLSQTSANLALVERAQADGVIVVGSDRLGVLHDMNCVLTILRRECPRLVENDAIMVVLSAPAQPDSSTGTNAAELAALGISRSVTTVARAVADSEGLHTTGDAIADWCDRLAPGTLTGVIETQVSA